MARGVTRPHAWSSLSQLKLAIVEYEATWWHTDPAIKSMIAAGEITVDELTARATPRGLTTTAAFRRADGSWHPARRPHQEQVIQACLGTGPAEAAPRAVFLTGCPGVGKTSQLAPIALAELSRASDGVAHVAVDRVREALDGYAHGLGSQVVNTEAQILTYGEVLPLAVGSRRHVLFDTIGRLEGSRASYQDGVEALRAAGFRISVLVASAPVDLCIERAEHRALSMGRIVPPDFQRTVHPEPPLALDALLAAGLVDDWAVVDTSGTDVQMLDAVPPWDRPGA
jgi:predicted ABC-type ATPase